MQLQRTMHVGVLPQGVSQEAQAYVEPWYTALVVDPGSTRAVPKFISIALCCLAAVKGALRRRMQALIFGAAAVFFFPLPRPPFPLPFPPALLFAFSPDSDRFGIFPLYPLLFFCYSKLSFL